VAAEYQEHFGEHAFDAEGNYIGPEQESDTEAAAATVEAPASEDATTGAPAVTGEDEPPGAASAT
jgi:small subunit ribosomal protein S1